MLSLLLFSLFLNKLVDKTKGEDITGVQLFPSIKELQMLMYADDIAILQIQLVVFIGKSTFYKIIVISGVSL